jgi:hypothetical protein
MEDKKFKIWEGGEWKGEGDLPTNFTNAEQVWYEEQAKQLASKYKVSEVHPCVLIDPKTMERTVAFISEPNYLTKLTVMDKALNIGPYMAASDLRNQCILKEESDAKTYGDSSDCDVFKLGVDNFCMGIVTRLQNQFQKK